MIPAFAISATLVHAEVSFEKEILPLIEAKCVECHRAPFEQDGRTIKPKAGLRLDGAWAILAGSEDGAVLKPGDADHSPIYLRTTLPPDDDDVMPPKGKAEPLTAAEAGTLKRWIDEGAKFGDWTGNEEGKPVETKPSGPAALSETQQIYIRLSEGLAMPDEKAWESITAAGGRVQRLAMTSPLLSVDFRIIAAEAGDEQILTARAIAPHVVHLDLSRTSATDAALAIVPAMPRLVRLNLAETAIGDTGLQSLKDLKELRYLNLHKTQVGDPGLEVLKNLKSLEAVYLWQSKVTDAGVERLRKALPDAKISFK